MVAAMTNNTMTLHQQAQQALSTLNCSHPDAGVMEFQRVLAQLAPGSHDAQAIKRAIDRLEEIAYAIAGVKGLLAGANFSFQSSDSKVAKLEATLDRLGVEAFGHDSSIISASELAAAVVSAGEHPDSTITELQAALKRIGPEGSNSRVIRHAIDRLEELAGQIADVEYSLANVDFNFGKLEV
jgi:hypothetical protein